MQKRQTVKLIQLFWASAVSITDGIKKQWVERNIFFLDCIGSRFGQSTRASLGAGEMVVSEVYETVISKFKTEEENKMHLEGLE